MKLLSCFALVCSTLTGFCANPAFQSFNSNDFLVTPNISRPQLISIQRGTNGFGTVYITNLYVQNWITTNIFVLNTNTYYTNFYSSNIFVTNITQAGGTTLVENVTQVFNTTTNFYDNSTLVINTNTTLIFNGTNITNIVQEQLWTNVANLYLRPVNASFALNIGSNATAGFLATVTNGGFAGGQFGGAASNNIVLPRGGSLAGGGFKDSIGNLVSADGGSHAGGTFAPGGNTNTVNAQQGSFAGVGSFGGSFNQVAATYGSMAHGRTTGGNNNSILADGGSEAMADMTGAQSATIQAGAGSTAFGYMQSFTNLHIRAFNGSLAGGKILADNERIEAWDGSFAFGQDVSSLTPFQWTFGRHYTNAFSEGFAIGYNGAPVFHVATNSGWTGSGTRVFVDNGMFVPLSGGGGGTNDLWTNDAAIYMPVTLQSSLVATGIVSKVTLETTGSFITSSQTLQALNAGTNTVVTTNKCLIYLYANSASPTYAQLTKATTEGARIVIINVVTNLQWSMVTMPLADDGSKAQYIRGNNWTPTEIGESIELIYTTGGWYEKNRANALGPAPALGTNYWTNIAGILQPIDLTLPLMITNQVQFGPGTSNYLSREGKDLVLHNSTTSGFEFIVRQGDGKEASFGVGNSGDGFVSSDGSDVLRLLGSSHGVMIFGSAFVPITDATEDLGNTNTSTWWRDAALKGSVTISGYASASGNSRLVTYHTGTNGAFVFDSQASGIAGPARGFLWASNGVTIASLSANSGYDSSGTHFLSDDGTYKTAGGGGTTINPTDGYLPQRQNGTTFVDSLLHTGTDPATSGAGTIATNNFAVVHNSSYLHLDENTIQTSGTIFIAGNNFGGIQLGSGDGAGFWSGRWNVNAITGHFSPVADNTYSIGSDTDKVFQLHANQARVFTNLTVYGYYDTSAATNFTALVISVNGTNGAGGIMFESQAGGVTGAPVPFVFTNAPVVLSPITKAQKTALTPAEGMLVFQSDNTAGLRVYQSGAWRMVSTAADP